jgi:hypothetical protein
MTVAPLAGRLRPTYADLAQAIEDGGLAVTRLGSEYFVTRGEQRRWQLDWLRARVRERHPHDRRHQKAS